MEKRTILLIFILLIGNIGYSQIEEQLKGQKELYDRPFMKFKGGCYCLNFISDKKMIADRLPSGILNLRVLDSWENIKNFELNSDEVPILPKEIDIENTIGYKYEMDEQYEAKVEAYSAMRNDLDTVFIYRDKPSRRVVLQDSKFPIWYFDMEDLAYGEVMCMLDLPYEPFALIIANNHEDPKFTQVAQVELGEDDVISTYQYQRILCPNSFDELWLERIRKGLVASGYLSDIPRTEFDIDMRNALYRFQRDHDIQVGFIDDKTLSKLNIKERI